MTTKSQSQPGKRNTLKQRSKKSTPRGVGSQREQIPLTIAPQRIELTPHSLRPREVLQLQRSIGNRAVGRLLAGTGQTTGQTRPAPARARVSSAPLDGFPVQRLPEKVSTATGDYWYDKNDPGGRKFNTYQECFEANRQYNQSAPNQQQTAEATRLQGEFKRIHQEAKKEVTFGKAVEQSLTANYERVRPIQKGAPPDNADAILEQARKFIEYIDLQQQQYNALLSDGLKQSLTFAGYPIVQAHNDFFKDISSLKMDQLPYFSVAGALRNAHEQVKRVQEKIRFLDRRIQDLGQSPQQAQVKLITTLTEEFQQRTATPEKQEKKTLDLALSQLEPKISELEKQKATLEAKQAGKLSQVDSPDGEFYRNPTLTTLQQLITANKIAEGQFIGNAYRTNYDVNGGFSLALSIANMSAYELHIHCTADGSIAGGGSKPVSIKPKGQRYDTGAGVAVSGTVRDTLLPNQVARHSHYTLYPP